ncbi:MAG TPA: toxin-antitoxin system HicB family antitoxin [Jatrophihabitantaceae bacterium]|nr:toxin-antitoxin system HicB family antitoxin [Jatrophihabitantaceae bacterium]
MHLDEYVAQVQQQLQATAALGDDRTQQIAEKVSQAAESSVRLAILSAVSEAADEISALLLDFPLSPSVSVRLDGAELRTDVEANASSGAEPPPSPAADEDSSARISLRLSESLKAEIDAAAARDGVSVNTWLVRAANTAVADGHQYSQRGGPRGTYTVNTSAHRVSGYING